MALRTEPLRFSGWRGLALLALSLASAGAVFADTTIDITQSVGSNAQPIVILPFTGSAPDSSNTSATLSNIISSDLGRSESIRPVPLGQLPSTSPQPGDLLNADWQRVPADLLVTGTIAAEGSNLLRVSYQLIRKASGESVLNESFTVANSRWREAAHLVSDRIYEQMTGRKGIYSSYIAYVNVYQQDGKTRYRLEVTDFDGGHRIGLLDSSEPIMSPSWSPDGKQLAYVSFESLIPQIYIHNLNTRKRQRITDFSGINGAPAWSPDGKQLVLTLSRDGNPELYLFDIASKALTRLTNNSAIDTEARWTADGKSLIFTSDRSGRAQIYRMSLSGDREARRISFNGNFNARADLSPDDRYLALVHSAGDGRYQIAVQDLRTNNFKTLTQNSLADSPSFSPDSRLLVYAVRQGEHAGLSITALDGSMQWRLPRISGEIQSPSWSPRRR